MKNSQLSSEIRITPSNKLANRIGWIFFGLLPTLLRNFEQHVQMQQPFCTMFSVTECWKKTVVTVFFEIPTT